MTQNSLVKKFVFLPCLRMCNIYWDYIRWIVWPIVEGLCQRNEIYRINVNTQWSYPLYANILDSLKMKNGISLTPLNCDLNALTFALNDSAAALVVLFTK